MLPQSIKDDDDGKPFTAYPVHRYDMRSLWHSFQRLSAVKKASMIFLVGILVCLLIYAIRQAIERSEMYRALKVYNELNLPADTIPILMPVYSRPQYLQRSLAALKSATDIDKTVLIISQDGNVPEITQLIQEISFVRVIHLKHYPPYFGIPSWFHNTDAPTAANVYFLLRTAFEYLHVHAAIVHESDLELSVDSLAYFRWAYEQTAKSKQLREKVFTVNGYYEKSSQQFGDPYTFTTDDYGFMVWGWLCPDYSWPLIRDGWTNFGNWDITLEHSVRRPSGKVSLSPTISRVRNIGMQGINFDIKDASEIAKWESLHIVNKPVNYKGQTLRVLNSAKDLEK